MVWALRVLVPGNRLGFVWRLLSQGRSRVALATSESEVLALIQQKPLHICSTAIDMPSSHRSTRLLCEELRIFIVVFGCSGVGNLLHGVYGLAVLCNTVLPTYKLPRHLNTLKVLDVSPDQKRDLRNLCVSGVDGIGRLGDVPTWRSRVVITRPYL